MAERVAIPGIDPAGRVGAGARAWARGCGHGRVRLGAGVRTGARGGVANGPAYP
jgi:hypothetical protein